MRKLTSTETIKELLRTYQDVTATLNAADTWIGEKPGSRTLVRPANHPYFTGSYRQLEEVLKFMRAGGKAVSHKDRKKVQAKYWAVNAEYISCEHRQTKVHVKRKARGRGHVNDTEWRMEIIRRKHIDERDLDAGIQWIADEFIRRQLVPWLPPEIHEYAAA